MASIKTFGVPFVKVIGTSLCQWESGRQLQLNPSGNMEVTRLDMAHKDSTNALVVIPKEKDGIIVADIPNILLQGDQDIAVFAVNVSGDKTEVINECVLSVKRRPKPDDYIYTETEVLNYTTLEKRISDMEKNGTVEVDPTLSVEGKAADAKAVGDAIKKAKPEGVVSYAKVQELTEEQQAQARANIGAAQAPLNVKITQYGDNCEWSATLWEIQSAIVENVPVTATLFGVINGQDTTLTTSKVYQADGARGNPEEDRIRFEFEWTNQNLLVFADVWDGMYGHGTGVYTQPMSATSTTYGNIKADPAEESDTLPARIGADGKLYVTPSGSSEGTPGGYYTPTVTQPSTNTMRISFSASEEGMPDLPDMNINLPAGSVGDDGLSILYATKEPVINPDEILEYTTRDIYASGRTIKTGDLVYCTANCCLYVILSLVESGLFPVELVGQIGGSSSETKDYIPIPKTATVGQTIQVTEVDEDGKPTKWEAVDFPSGGGSGEWKVLHEAELSEASTIRITDFDRTLQEYVFHLIIPKVTATINTGNSSFLGARAFIYSQMFGSTSYATHYSHHARMISNSCMILVRYQISCNGTDFNDEYVVSAQTPYGSVVGCNVNSDVGIDLRGTFPAGTKFRLEGR